jgi:hypothetical protein
MPIAEAQKIPLTLVVGFLGAGKTSLVSRILAGRGTRRLAVIENELGEVGIDSQLGELRLGGRRGRSGGRTGKGAARRELGNWVPFAALSL